MININHKSNAGSAREECVAQILDGKIDVEDDMMKIVRKICGKYKVGCLDLKKINLLETYTDLLGRGQIEKSEKFENMMIKRRIRTESGVSVLSVMTKPLGCPGRCVYCPNMPNMPKSYLDNQPAAMRGVMNDFDPFDQVYSRLLMLHKMGHDVTKNEVIILGGTFSAHPVKYQELFVKRIFDAVNSFGADKVEIAENLPMAKKINESAKCRIIGLTIETRPDFVTANEIVWLRYLGVTRVELGVQSVFDDVLKLVKRGHDIEQTKKATILLRQAGFKIVYHIMPGLPGATRETDIEMFEILFSDPGLLPDHLKIYPTVVLENSEMYEWWKQGKYRPYSETEVEELLTVIKKDIPKWVRIVRVMRDIPESSVIDGVKSSNLRQKLSNKKVNCKCIRCREPKGAVVNDYVFSSMDYLAANGREYFMSFESSDQKYILALVRLYLPNQENEIWKVLPGLKEAALIRELHTYGQVMGVDKKGKKIQHRGLGKKLMLKAEELAKEKGFKKMAVIAGVGVREYYQKIGYRLEGEYMVKDLI
jgi:elongator complex protein 3